MAGLVEFAVKNVPGHGPASLGCRFRGYANAVSAGWTAARDELHAQQARQAHAREVLSSPTFKRAEADLHVERKRGYPALESPDPLAARRKELQEKLG